jgi:hypothetical protein
MARVWLAPHLGESLALDPNPALISSCPSCPHLTLLRLSRLFFPVGDVCTLHVGASPVIGLSTSGVLPALPALPANASVHYAAASGLP